MGASQGFVAWNAALSPAVPWFPLPALALVSWRKLVGQSPLAAAARPARVGGRAYAFSPADDLCRDLLRRASSRGLTDLTIAGTRLARRDGRRPVSS